MTGGKKILIINGHPYEDKLGYRLHERYRQGALDAGHEVYEIFLKDIQFTMNLSMGYKAPPAEEADIEKAQNLIRQADHLVFIYPNWWGTWPALFKGFIDRTFLPGFAFRYEKDKGLQKLLRGKSAHIIVTMDNPVWHYLLIQGAPGHKAMRHSILQFCGIHPVRFSTFGNVRKSSESRKERWSQQIYRHGFQAN